METKFNFNSQICTTREQSERLLSLGLKKETADMWYPHFAKTCPLPLVDEVLNSDDIPAWSLHRLIEMIQEVCTQVLMISHRVDIRSNVKRIAYSFDVCDNLYNNLIDCIEWLIKEGYFPKEFWYEKSV